MIIRNKYQLVIAQNTTMDLADISEQEFEQIKLMAKQIINDNESDSIVMAYFAAFTVYITDMQILMEPYDPDRHLYM